MKNTKQLVVSMGFAILVTHTVVYAAQETTLTTPTPHKNGLTIDQINQSIQDAYNGKGEGAKALEMQQKAYSNIHQAISNAKLTTPAQEEMKTLSPQEQQAIQKSMDGWTESRKNRWKHSGGRVDILENQK